MLGRIAKSKRLLIASIFGFSSVSLLFVSPVVHATSSYDDVITLGEAKVICPGNQVIDLTTTYVSHVLGINSGFDNALYGALNYGYGWGLAQHVNVSDGTASLFFYVSGFPPAANAYFADDSSSLSGVLRSGGTKLMVLHCNGSGGIGISNNSLTANRPLAYTDSTNGYDLRPVYMNWPISYPPDYEGIVVPGVMTDIDGDGLNETAEQVQGTSDFNKDTDGDGLNDYIESQWNSSRNTVFCGTQCAYPDPTTKDVYVEVDWMNNPNGTSYQPSGTQLNQVKSAFNARGVNAHFDTGQYGGGNELSNYEQALSFAQDSNNFDFYDYKNGTSTTIANFDSSRKRIWHYMISGYQYAENTGSSGASFAGDDDFFISYGLIKNSQSSFGYLDLDDAIAGTIIHEFGHNLCLTDTAAYSGQSSNCVYDGVDNASASSSYVSSMNYSYQMFMVGYSMGQNGIPNDHDDWGAVEIGMKDFSNVGRDAGDIMNGKSKTKKLIQGISIDQAKDLRKKNKLGKRNVNYFTRQLQMLVR